MGVWLFDPLIAAPLCGPHLDAQRIIASLADREPGEFYIVDANGGFTPEAALRLVSLLPNGLDFVFEAPCATWSENLSFRKRCSLPIFYDELVQQDEHLIRLIALDAADGIGLKISKAGGLTHSRRQRDIATSAGLTISVQDTVGSTIAFAGIVHLAASVRPNLLRCILKCDDMVTLKTANLSALLGVDGISISNAPGLGLDVHEEVLGDPVACWSL